MHFEADIVRLRTEAAAFEDIIKKLNRSAAVIADIHAGLRTDENENLRELAAGLKVRSEEIAAISRRAAALHEGLEKVTAICSEYEGSAADMIQERTWHIPGRSDGPDGKMLMLPIADGISGSAACSPELVELADSIGLTGEEITAAIVLR